MKDAEEPASAVAARAAREVGQVAGVAQLIVSSGARGKRFTCCTRSSRCGFPKNRRSRH